MSEFNYDSYCGHYCGACSILKAYQTGIRDKFASFWAEQAGLELKCHGCKTEQVFAGCSICKMRKCARDKKLERCLECGDFPCDQYNMDEHEFLSGKLPHVKLIIDNINDIKNLGAQQWLESQGRFWQCPDCHTEFTWYAVNCSKCGRPLEELKGFKSEFDGTIFGFESR